MQQVLVVVCTVPLVCVGSGPGSLMGSSFAMPSSMAIVV
jgi:hypothetical protein